MKHRFARKHDIIRAFASSMNLISPEVENHHEKVSFLAYRLAEIPGMDEDQKRPCFMLIIDKVLKSRIKNDIING